MFLLYIRFDLLYGNKVCLTKKLAEKTSVGSNSSWNEKLLNCNQQNSGISNQKIIKQIHMLQNRVEIEIKPSPGPAVVITTVVKLSWHLTGLINSQGRQRTSWWKHYRVWALVSWECFLWSIMSSKPVLKRVCHTYRLTYKNTLNWVKILWSLFALVVISFRECVSSVLKMRTQ